MRIHRAPLAGFVTLVACFALAIPQSQTKITGLITLRSGEVMNVKTGEGIAIEVVLNSDTKIEEPQGVLGFRNKDLNLTALVPGLNVTVQGLQYQNNQLIAKTVTVSRRSLQSANTAQFSQSDMGQKTVNPADYEVKATYDAHFATGSALLSQTDKAGLQNLAGDAAALPGYMIEVRGFSDFAGGNSYDQQLAGDRAEAVIDFLRTSGRIPVTRIVAPGAMDASAPPDASGSPQGTPQAGRAEVKVLVKPAGK